MRGWLAWTIGIAAGIALVLVATAMVGNRDDSGETVPAGQWAQSVCGSIGVWRGEIEDIVDGDTPGAGDGNRTGGTAVADAAGKPLARSLRAGGEHSRDGGPRHRDRQLRHPRDR